MKFISLFILLVIVYLSPVMAGPVDKGKEIFLNRCGMCHKYPEPSALNSTHGSLCLKKCKNEWTL